MRMVLSGLALAGSLVLSGCGWKDWQEGLEADPSVSRVYAQDLPVWPGPGVDARWDEALKVRKAKPPKSSALPLAAHAGPVKASQEVLYFKLLEYGLTDRPPLPMPGGWLFSMEFGTCLSAKITMTNQRSGRSDSMVVWLDREAPTKQRILRCGSNYALAWFAVAPNDRYIAFRTTDPGWVFFDRSAGRFLPMMVMDRQPVFSTLSSSPAGEVLLEVMEDDGRSSVKSVVYRGAPLAGRFDPLEQAQVRKLNSEMACRVARANGERNCPLPG